MTGNNLAVLRRAAMRTSDRWPDELYYLLPVVGIAPSFTPVPTGASLAVIGVAIFAFMGRLARQSDKIDDQGRMHSSP